MNDDISAISRLKNGDIGGLETLVSHYQLKAIRTAFLIVRDEKLAEDIVQDTFVKIFKHIQRFDLSRPFEPYLLKSVVNAALDAARETTKQEILTVGIETVEELIEQAITVEKQVEFNVLKLEIHQALELLSPRQRAAIVMRYFLDMSENEMAQVLNSAPGTIKWLLNAAREHLRQLLSVGSTK